MKSERDRINELLPNKKIFLFFPPWVMEICICSHYLLEIYFGITVCMTIFTFEKNTIS